MRLRRALGGGAISLLLVIILVPVGFRVAAAWRETAVAADVMPSGGRYVATRAGRIFVQEAGPRDGVPVVLFHGTAAWSELWRETMTALAAARFRAIALDIPPFGYSERPEHAAYTRADQAVRAGDVLDGLGVRKAVILGHSFGAGAAVETVLRHPDRIAALVLVDAALGLTVMPSGSTTPPWPLRVGWLRETLVATTVTNPLLTRTLLAALLAKKERATDQYVTVLQRPMTIRNTTRDLGEWLVYFTSDDRGALSAGRQAYKTITAKTAILWGEQDGITPLVQGEDLRSLIPGSTLTVLPGVGHIPYIEDPGLFNRVLIERLRALT